MKKHIDHPPPKNKTKQKKKQPPKTTTTTKDFLAKDVLKQEKFLKSKFKTEL